MPKNLVVFIGLGAIGLPMAEKVQAGGYDVMGIERSSERRRIAASVGIRSEATVAEVEGSDRVVVMVATPKQLDALVDEALRTIVVSGQCWIIMSTVGPSSIRSAAGKLGAAGAEVVDAPVTGGVARAKTGSLVVFASGESAALASCADLLGTMGTVTTVGEDIGTGQSYKIVNQHLCVIHLAAAAEALALAKSLGLDQDDVLRLLGKGAANSWMLSDRGPRMLADGDVPVTSAIAIMQKDTALVQLSSQEVGATTPMLEAAADRYRLAEAMGLVESDDSQLIQTYAQEASS